MSAPHTLRVLLVDDDVDSSELIAEVLRVAGHQVHVAGEPGAALLAVETFHPDVAIVDIGLPEMDGYQLAREMRKLSPCKLIALSGYTADTAPADTAVTSFEHHLIKPFDYAALVQIITAMKR